MDACKFSPVTDKMSSLVVIPVSSVGKPSFFSLVVFCFAATLADRFRVDRAGPGFAGVRTSNLTFNRGSNAVFFLTTLLHLRRKAVKSSCCDLSTRNVTIFIAKSPGVAGLTTVSFSM